MKKVISFTPTSERAAAFPPEPLKKHVPKWFRDMPIYTPGHSMTAENFQLYYPNDTTAYSAKKCTPLLDYFTSGYTLRLTSDLMLSKVMDEDKHSFYWRTPHSQVMVAHHGYEQCPISIKGKKYNYLKIFPNFIIRTPPGYSCLFTPSNPITDEQPLTFLSAIVDTDQYHDEIGFICYTNDGWDHITLDAGTPFINVFPFKRDDWKMKVPNVIEQEYAKKERLIRSRFFSGLYRRFAHSKKDFD